MLSFESVKQRLARESPLSFLEFNYMILQADGSSSSATATTIAATPPPPPLRTTPTATTPLPTGPPGLRLSRASPAARRDAAVRRLRPVGKRHVADMSETCPRLVRRLRPVGKHHLWRRARVGGGRRTAARRSVSDPSRTLPRRRRADGAQLFGLTAPLVTTARRRRGRQRGRGGPSADVCGRSPV